MHFPFPILFEKFELDIVGHHMYGLKIRYRPNLVFYVGRYYKTVSLL